MNIELDPDDGERFAVLKRNVKEFVDWAAAELGVLNALR